MVESSQDHTSQELTASPTVTPANSAPARRSTLAPIVSCFVIGIGCSPAADPVQSASGPDGVTQLTQAPEPRAASEEQAPRDRAIVHVTLHPPQKRARFRWE